MSLVNLNADKGGELFWQIAAWCPDWQFRGVRGAYGQQVMPPPRLPNCEVVDSVPGHRMREHVHARSRVMLMPSLYESWGRVAIEAFASGIPVIAHPTPGLVEALGQAGIFAYRDDPTAWIDALNSLRNPDTWQRAFRRALARSDELSAACDLALWCDAVEELGKDRAGSSSGRRTPDPPVDARPVTAGTPPDGDDADHVVTPASARSRLPTLRWVRRVFDEHAGPLRAGAGRRPAAPSSGQGAAT